MFKSHQIKLNQRVPRKNEVETYGAPVFAPDYSTTVLGAKMCTDSNEHSLNVKFLQINFTNIFSAKAEQELRI
jgi:hypothetical protein